MKFKAVLFDLDGTLLDTLEDLANSMNQVLLSFGLPTHEIPAYRYMVGEGVEVLVRRALPQDRLDEDTVARCMAGMREGYRRRWAETTRPYEGIPELLDGLTRRGLRLAVLSNKPDDMSKAVVGRFLSHWKFDPVWGARPGVPKKPHPAPLLEIARILGIHPEEFLYLGDTSTDMKAAQAAGMWPVGALWGFRTAEELLSSGARALLERPQGLLDLLE